MRTPESFSSKERGPEIQLLTLEEVASTVSEYMEKQEDKDYLKEHAEDMREMLVAFSYAESINALSEEPYDMTEMLKELVAAHKEGTDPVIESLPTMKESLREAWRTSWRKRLIDRRNAYLPEDEKILDQKTTELDRALAESQAIELAVLSGESVDTERTFLTRLRIQRLSKKVIENPDDTVSKSQLAFLLLERLGGPHMKMVSAENIEQHGSGITLDLVEDDIVVAAATVDLTDGMLSVSKTYTEEERLTDTLV